VRLLIRWSSRFCSPYSRSTNGATNEWRNRAVFVLESTSASASESESAKVPPPKISGWSFIWGSPTASHRKCGGQQERNFQVMASPSPQPLQDHGRFKPFTSCVPFSPIKEQRGQI
jgi:hypothetical protein